MSRQKNLSCLGFFLGDEILHRYMGITISHEIRILIKQPVQWKVRRPFFVAHMKIFYPNHLESTSRRFFHCHVFFKVFKMSHSRIVSRKHEACFGVVDANTSWITMCCFFRERPKGLEKEEEEEKDNDASHYANTFAPVSCFS